MQTIFKREHVQWPLSWSFQDMLHKNKSSMADHAPGGFKISTNGRLLFLGFWNIFDEEYIQWPLFDEEHIQLPLYPAFQDIDKEHTK